MCGLEGVLRATVYASVYSVYVYNVSGNKWKMSAVCSVVKGLLVFMDGVGQGGGRGGRNKIFVLQQMMTSRGSPDGQLHQEYRSGPRVLSRRVAQISSTSHRCSASVSPGAGKRPPYWGGGRERERRRRRCCRIPLRVTFLPSPPPRRAPPRVAFRLVFLCLTDLL